METHAKLIPPSEEFKKQAHLGRGQYLALYEQSLKDPERFWSEQAQHLTWMKNWNRVQETQFHKPIKINWFEGGVLNACYNCVDRHLNSRAAKVALYWEPDHPQEPSRAITYQELYEEVQIFASILKSKGVNKGDRVIIYMPMIPETAFAMLACARIGAVHSVVFAGFSPEAIHDRISDCGASFVITCDGGMRGGKLLPLKQNVDEALEKPHSVKSVLVVRYAKNPVIMHSHRDSWYHQEVRDFKENWLHAEVAPEPMLSSDPLFILYTSGSTNKPKGVLHSTGGYMVYASTTFHYVFDYKEKDVFWCTADVGWVTGHSYSIYGPLSHGASIVLFEGVPHYPSQGRFWEIIDKYQVSVFYTAPTALRALMKAGDQHVKESSRRSLRLLGSVGEPINPEVWMWYYNVVGDGRCPIVDTWWQTETGGVLMVSLPGAVDMKPGSTGLPFFGVRPHMLTPEGVEIRGPGEGILALENSWPGQMTTIFGNHDRFEETYFSTFTGLYFTGDGCRRDEDGYYWITGRVDDVINVSGHRIGTAELESAFVLHKNVAEAAVVGVAHDIKGQCVHAYITLKDGVVATEELRKDLAQWIRHEIGAFAAPEKVLWAPRLPKTRSGKIMRRILRKISEGALESLGDTSTLADPNVVEELIQSHSSTLPSANEKAPGFPKAA
ncbi:MAG: acetate--CoA ligase [Bdellovibrio sp.]